jgi:hypothetical protein
MRRGLLKDLANTPTQIACGWRLYGDLPRLRKLTDSIVTIDLLTGASSVDGRDLVPTLEIAEETSHWLRDRFDRDGVPDGTVRTARLTLSLRQDEDGMLAVDCATELETESNTFLSRDTTRWHSDD